MQHREEPTHERELRVAVDRLATVLSQASVGLELELRWLREAVDSLTRAQAEHA